MLLSTFSQITVYIIIGLTTAFLIDRTIRNYTTEEPYTTNEIFWVILLWPLNVLFFVTYFIYNFFK